MGREVGGIGKEVGGGGRAEVSILFQGSYYGAMISVIVYMYISGSGGGGGFLRL